MPEKTTGTRPCLSGQLTQLRPLEPEDLPVIAAWDRDPEIVELMGQKFGLSESAEEWYTRTQTDRSCRAMAILTLDGHLIGEVEVDRIDWRVGSAELRICIGEKAYWGRGYGRDALFTFLSLSFYEWALRTVYLRVYRMNQRAVRLYRRLGFVVEGILAPSRRRGDRSEVWLMALSRQQFEQVTSRWATAVHVSG